jgi:hypothetical protein
MHFLVYSLDKALFDNNVYSRKPYQNKMLHASVGVFIQVFDGYQRKNMAKFEISTKLRHIGLLVWGINNIILYTHTFST